MYPRCDFEFNINLLLMFDHITYYLFELFHITGNTCAFRCDSMSVKPYKDPDNTLCKKQSMKWTKNFD